MDQLETIEVRTQPQTERHSRACRECNRKKNKCDRQQPACGLCHRTGAACEYPQQRRAPRLRVLKAQKPSSDISVSKWVTVDDLLGVLEPNLRKRFLSAKAMPANTEPNSQSPGQPQLATPSPSTSLQPDQSPRLRPPATPSSAGMLDALHDARDTTNASHSNAEQGISTENLFSPAMTTSLPALNAVAVQASNRSSSDCMSHGVINDLRPDDQLDLVELYFSHVQLWLPLLHRPRFYAQYLTPCLARGQPLQLDALSMEMQLVFLCIFALAARYSKSIHFAETPPPERGERYIAEAERLYEALRQSADQPCISLLQGYILLAFYYFTSGPMSSSWNVVSRCVDLAYDLDLDSIDDEVEDAAELCPEEWVTKEEFRRAWWLVWELDTFSSTISRRPYRIDKKRMMVHLPCSDEAWYSGMPVSSARLMPDPKEAWNSLGNCANQDERAWYLIIKFLSSIAHDLAQLRPGVPPEQKRELELSFRCFRLALPPEFELGTSPLTFNHTNTARRNWIIAAHLILAGTNLTLSTIVEAGSSSGNARAASSRASLHLARLDDVTWIINNWPPDHIKVAHPFIACTMMPVYTPGNSTTSPNPPSLAHTLPRLVLGHYGRVWKLGNILLKVANMRERSQPMTENEVQLARRFAAIFPPEVTRKSHRSSNIAFSPGTSDGSTPVSENLQTDMHQESEFQPELDRQCPSIRTVEMSHRDPYLSPMAFDFTAISPELAILGLDGPGISEVLAEGG